MKDLIMIIDDDPGIKMAFEKVLTGENFLITTSSNSERLIELIGSKKPRVVILDMKMPGFSGADLLRKIKKSKRKLPVIIMTAYSNMFTEKDAFMLGADAYLKKPFEISTMLLKLRSLVNDQN
jgi:DNA-binding response OmpR family regulator